MSVQLSPLPKAIQVTVYFLLASGTIALTLLISQLSAVDSHFVAY